jgi:hypothetical protein
MAEQHDAREALRGLLEIEEARIATGAFKPNAEAMLRIEAARAALATPQAEAVPQPDMRARIEGGGEGDFLPAVRAVAIVEKQLDDNCARIRWMFNPVPDGQELLWDHGDATSPPSTPEPAGRVEAQGDAVGILQEEAFGRGVVFWFKKPPDGTKLYAAPAVELSEGEMEWLWVQAEGLDGQGQNAIAFGRSVERAVLAKAGIQPTGGEKV